MDFEIVINKGVRALHDEIIWMQFREAGVVGKTTAAFAANFNPEV